MKKSTPFNYKIIENSIFIHDLKLKTKIGINKNELNKKQKIILNLDIGFYKKGFPKNDKKNQFICYEEIVKKIKIILNKGHIGLVETAINKITSVLFKDRRIKSVIISINKISAIKEASGAGAKFFIKRKK